MTRPLDEPFYVLDVLYSSSSPIEFEQDRSKSETTKCIKTKWFTDIERYKRAMELRFMLLLFKCFMPQGSSNLQEKLYF